MRVLLLVSAFDGLAQRVWCALRAAGHQAGVLLAGGPEETVAGVASADPELVLCPYPAAPVPEPVWRHRRTVVIHPGPVGERGPSSLDWAITEGAPVWGVTATGAAGEPGAGPVWATRTFGLPAAAPRKSSLSAGPVADAVLEVVAEVLDKARDPAFRPVPADRAAGGVPGARPRPAMTQADRRFDWAQTTEHVVRRIRAADGSPGVRTEVAGLAVHAYDAHPGTARGARPGAVVARRQGAVLVATGDGGVWLGQLRAAGTAVTVPATTLLGRRLAGVPHAPLPPGAEAPAPSYRQVRYRRTAHVGWVAFDAYDGATGTGLCRRLLAALRHALAQDTRVVVLRGGVDAFGTGIHLGVVEAAADPAAAAWANVRAATAVCRELVTARQVVVAAYAGSAAAGGAMLGLGADVVAARAGVVLNPWYGLGLHGADLHTYTLPRRVGAPAAQRLADARLPVGAEQAAGLGLVDEVGPRHPDAYTAWLGELADRLADRGTAARLRAAKVRRLAGERVPLDAYEARELAETSRDLFADRHGFAAARHAFLTGARPAGALPRPAAGPAPAPAGPPAVRPAVPAPA